MHEKGQLNADLTVKRHLEQKKTCCAFSGTLFYHTPSFIISFYHLSQMMLSNLKSYSENTKCCTIICLSHSSPCLIAS